MCGVAQLTIYPFDRMPCSRTFSIYFISLIKYLVSRRFERYRYNHPSLFVGDNELLRFYHGKCLLVKNKFRLKQHRILSAVVSRMKCKILIVFNICKYFWDVKVLIEKQFDPYSNKYHTSSNLHIICDPDCIYTFIREK